VGQTTELPQFNDGRPGDRDFFWPVVRQTAIALRSKNDGYLIGVVTNPGGAHMDWTEDQSRFLALFIHKACKYRLPGSRPLNGKIELKKINRESGWLTDTGGLEPDKFQAALYRKYKGNPKFAYWFFDEEMARAAIAFNGDRKFRQKQMTTFVQNRDTLTVNDKGSVQLKLLPEPDGITFKVGGGFLNEVPRGLIDAGTKLGHATGSFRVYHILGPVVQLGSGKFRIQFDRQSGRNVILMSDHPGDKKYRRATQPGNLVVPARLISGHSQQITFPQIKNQKAGIKSLLLQASSSSAFPVNFYVVAGPAVIKGNMLKFTPIPVRSKYPVKVSVVAYQWGTTIAPMFQSAQSVIREFFLINY